MEGMPLVPSKSEAELILEPYLHGVQTSVKNAVTRYMNYPSQDRATRISTRSRASLIYDFMKDEALTVLGKLPNPPHMFERRGQLCILIAGQFLMKLKKLDKQLRPSYTPTQSALQFMTHNENQPAFAFLEEAPPVTNVVAGYRWNDSETEADVFIVCPLGKELAWDIAITAKVDTTPAVPATAKERTRKRKVVAKELPITKDGTGGDQHA